MNITVYGDSILKGVLLEDGKYKINRDFEQSLAEESGGTIRNKAHFGSTIGKAMGLIERDCAVPGAGETALLEFGGNDCDYDWKAIAADPAGSHFCNTPPEDFARAYRRAIRLLTESGRRALVLTLPPIHAERYFRFICRDGLSRSSILAWLGDVDAIYRWQRTYSELAAEIAREEGSPVVDLRRVFRLDGRSMEELLCLDGIHPSRAGQGLICRSIAEALG